MKNLPANLVIEKNKLNTANPWLILLDITLVDPADGDNTEEFYVVRNTENITYQSREYTAFPFEIEPTKQESKGQVPTVTLQISNVTRYFQPYIEAFNGGMRSTVKVTVVNAAHLSEDYSELEMTFTVLTCSSTDKWITFTLGAPNPLLQRFPLHRYLALHCNWKFKSVECGYSGGETSCDRTLVDCQNNKNNAARFGGFPGMKSGGIRIA